MANGKSLAGKTIVGCGARLLLASVLLFGLSGCFEDEPLVTDDTAGDTGGTPPPPGATNRSPSISGSPTTTAKTSVAYSFQPVASDPDGDALAFEVRGKPDWATFDSGTGRLSGTPADGDTGTYANIQILVSDGKVQASLPTFTITVSAPVVGAATLSWQPPSLNEDGTPLTDLSGYVVRYGRNPSVLDQRINLANPGLTTVVVENLVEGTWYFTLASVNSSGVESRSTGYVSKTIS